ncbi:MAG: hypothetical protein ABJB16_17900 [Saprospiraceae bacterium]
MTKSPDHQIAKSPDHLIMLRPSLTHPCATAQQPLDHSIIS